MLSRIPTLENPVDELKFLQTALDLIGERITGYESRFERLRLQHQKTGERLKKLQELADLFNLPPTVE